MKTRLFRLAVLTLTLISLVGQVEPAWGQAGTTFFITDVNSSQFPTVSFRLRAIDLNNRVVDGFDSSNLTVYENGQPVPAEGVQVTAHDDGPIAFLFLLDHGRLANFNEFGPQNIRQVFSALAGSGVFVNGRDQVEVMVRENMNTDRTEARLGPTQEIGDLMTWLANYPFEVRRSQNSTKGLEGVADAITEMGKLVPVPGSQTAVVLFVTRFIEDPARSVAVVAAQNQASQAKSQFISIYAFSTDQGQSNKEPLEILAEVSNGRYTPLQRTTAGTLAEDVYREINAQRVYYTVSYQSALPDAGQRLITVNTRETPPVGAVGAYQVSPQPPIATMVEPAPGTIIQREAVRDPEGEPVYSPTSLAVVADVAFPDGYTRSLRSAELIVNGASQETVSPAPGSNQAQLDLDLAQFSTEGTNQVALEVRVVDSLGLEFLRQDVGGHRGRTAPAEYVDHRARSVWRGRLSLLVGRGVGRGGRRRLLLPQARPPTGRACCPPADRRAGAHAPCRPGLEGSGPGNAGGAGGAQRTGRGSDQCYQAHHRDRPQRADHRHSVLRR